ncbi:hypothetical protein GL218_06316 [Daldinia childiae]|uniref:uncharacterized protein n=1 Tax=Daldinia childiae TaxID=326645 RepID=UPI001447719A|nr:uncharacterized protein GL218_06316 [Daldinia childiae]KAF3057248.1 hypothetical protein GL218_06316 [Daldinia childiae]
MLRGRRSHYRGIVRNESSANEWLKQRLSQPPCKEKWWEATDPVPPAPLFPRYIENPAPVKRFSLADWSGHNAFMAGIQNSASGFINGAPVFGVLTAPAPVPAPEPQLLSQPIYQQVLHQPEWVPEPQLPSQPIYQQVFHQPEWVPESQPPELASVVVYPANNVNFNTPCEPAVPALGQAIDIYNHNATPLYVTPQEPAPIVPTPMEVDIPEQVETLPEAMEDVQVDVQNTTGFMSVEQMEDDLVDHFEALANAQASVSDNTNAGQADNAQDDQPGYESLDDRMGASPFNDCKIREKQTPTKSQSQPMHKPKSDKPHALSSSVQSSSTTPSKSLGGGLQASMYNANNLASAAQTPSSQALSSTLQSKPPVKQSPLTKALAQLSNPQMPLPQAQQTIAQSSPAPPMSQFSVPQVQLPQVPATTPKPKQTVQQMPLPQALPQTLQPQPTTSQMAWPQPAPPVSEPQQTMVLPPLKPQQTTQQKPSTQALPQKPKPQPTTSQLTGSETTSSTPKPKQTTSQEPSSQALPQMPQVQKAMASTRRIATPKSRKAMINQAEKPSSTTAAQAPAPKPKAAARLPGKSKPANATSVLYTEPGPSVPKKDKGKGRATQPPVLVDEEDDFEDKVCEFMDGGLSNEQAYIMAEHYFNQRRISRR